MNENISDIENVKKRFEDLDGELNVFLEAIRELKEIRDNVGTLPEKLKENEEFIDRQKEELNSLISSSNNILISVGEKAKGVIFDLEKKTEELSGDVKSGISQIGSLFHQGNEQLQETHREKVNELLTRYDEMKSAKDTLKGMVDHHEQSLNVLKNNYMVVSSIFAKLELALIEMKKNISELQKRPYEISHKIKAVEERIHNFIEEKNNRQKSFNWIVISVLVATIIFTVMINIL